MWKGDYSIQLVSIQDAEICADVIRRSFATVAEEFGYTRESVPTHTSFMTVERWEGEIRRGRIPYGLFVAGEMIGYVSLGDMGDGWWELNHLAVLPEYRHRGYGWALLAYCQNLAEKWSGKGIRLSIIEESARLKAWYIGNGFVSTGTRVIAALPFTIGDMEWIAGSAPESP